MSATLSRRRLLGTAGKAIVMLMLIVLALGTLFPLYWAVATSLKTEQKAMAIPPQWIPDPFRPQNYTEAWTMLPFARFYLNTAIISVLGTVGALLTSAMAGYALAKYHFKGRNTLLMIIVGTMMVPYWVNLVPVYILISRLGWLDSYHGLIVPMLARPFGIFLMRQYMVGVHSEYIDSARIDGASEFRIFWQVVLPQCTPALATLTIFFFVADWNSFMWPLIVTSSLEMRTVTVGLSLLAGQYRSQYARQMAAATLGSLPAVAVFVAFQKYFTEGLTLSGLKG